MANNPQFRACNIEAAAYTYYWTKSQETSLKERGMYAERNCIRRRRERLLRKLLERNYIFDKAELAPKDKEKWRKVLKAELISSEESSQENDDVFVKHIPWRSTLVNNFSRSWTRRAWTKKQCKPTGREKYEECL